MGSIGPMEMAVVLVLALLVFGPKKLPEIGKGVGEAMREFKKASRDLMSSFHEDTDQRPYSRPPSQTEPFPTATTEPVYPHPASSEEAPSEREPASTPGGPTQEPLPASGGAPSASAPAEPAHETERTT
jgi:sec-independent protein translocase protein TatA